MTPVERFTVARTACPLVAILRGVTPDTVEAIGDALVDAGFRLIEVPLNSPDPYDSIGRLAKRFAASDVVIGAGTVLDPTQVDRVAAAGGTLIVSPSVDVRVIATSVAASLISLPGYFTPSEAFAAIGAGAHGLKLFPAEAASPRVLKAQRAVLPRALPLFVVGGVAADGMSPWVAAGADGFGIGSALYAPGMSAHEVGGNAKTFVAAWRALG